MKTIMTQTLLHSGKRLAQYQCFVLIVLGIRFVCQFSMLAFLSRDPQKDFLMGQCNAEDESPCKDALARVA